MEDQIRLERAQQHFAAGRTDQAIESLLNTKLFRNASLDEARALVEVKVAEDLVSWGRRNAERTVTFGSYKRPSSATDNVFDVEGDSIVSRAIAFNDEDPSVFAIRNATVGFGNGLISTEDGKIIEIAPNWGVQTRKGDRARAAYGALCNRDESDEFLYRRFDRTTSLPEAIYLWVGCKHFGTNLTNLIHVALLREALGDTNLPLVAQKKGMPPRQFELDAIRKMGFANNEIMCVDNRPRTFVEKLWVPHCPITFYPQHVLSCSAGMNIFRDRLGIAKLDEAAAGERIYITRRDAKWRLVEDEDALIAMLRDEFGFRVVEFTGMELDQRLAELARAKIILGPTGQNMFHMMFAPPGCWVAEILPVTHKDGAVRDCIAHLALSMGHKSIRIPCDTRQTDDDWIRWDISVRYRELRTALEFMTQ